MTPDQFFASAKQNVIGDNLIIKSVADAEVLHNKFIELRSHLRGVVDVMPHYRGEQNAAWDIRPGIFRPPLNISDPTWAKQLEKEAVGRFEKAIIDKIGQETFRSIFNGLKFGKDWDLLMQAQHAGIKTTLTDWSPEVVMALYFATEHSDDPSLEMADGQLWCLITPTNAIVGHNDHKPVYDLDPYNMSRTVMINPSSYLDDIDRRLFEFRMYRQKGRFVMASNNTCHIPLNKQSGLQTLILKAVIPANYKQRIREELALRGVVRNNMYIEESETTKELIKEINMAVFALP